LPNIKTLTPIASHHIWQLGFFILFFDMELRPYQEALILQIKSEFAKGKKKVIMQSATGSGKTVTFVELTKRTLQKDRNSSVLIFTNRTELQKQAERTLKNAGIETHLLSAGSILTELKPGCTVAMVETFNRREIDTSRLKLAIIDEVHLGNFRKIIPKLGNAFIVGATATPISSKKDAPLKNDYESIVTGISIQQLIKSGYLAKPSYFHLVPKNIDKLRIENGEFSDDSQIKVFEDAELYADLIREFQKFSDKKTIVFCNSISTTKAVTAQFQAAGFKADYVVSGIDTRQDVFSDFSANKLQILVNCGIATTGFDEPSIECVIIYRATKSLTLYLQMIGRGSRTTEAKKTFTVLDFGKNIVRHGFWHDEIDWVDKFANPDKKSDGVAPVKECKSCGALIHATATKCEHCGAEVQKKVKIKNETEAELAEIVPKVFVGRRLLDLTVDELIHLCEVKKYSHHFLVRVLRRKGFESLLYYEKLRGFKSGWARMNNLGNTQINNFLIK